MYNVHIFPCSLCANVKNTHIIKIITHNALDARTSNLLCCVCDCCCGCCSVVFDAFEYSGYRDGWMDGIQYIDIHFLTLCVLCSAVVLCCVWLTYGSIFSLSALCHSRFVYTFYATTCINCELIHTVELIVLWVTSWILPFFLFRFYCWLRKLRNSEEKTAVKIYFCIYVWANTRQLPKTTQIKTQSNCKSARDFACTHFLSSKHKNLITFLVLCTFFSSRLVLSGEFQFWRLMKVWIRNCLCFSSVPRLKRNRQR